MTIVYSIAVLAGVGIAAGAILVAAYSRLKVEEDPGVERINELLPGINCGACGYASCHEFAAAAAEGKVSPGECRAASSEIKEKIAEISGCDYACGQEAKKAVIKCGAEERKMLADYEGPAVCGEAALTGGGLACRWGCLGFGDCAEACPYDAIELNESSLPVVDLEKCTGCGLCVKACPRNLIELKEISDKRVVYVGCSNRQVGKTTRKICSSGCIACGICVKKGPEGSFEVSDNLAALKIQKEEIDVGKIKCPVNCIYESSAKPES